MANEDVKAERAELEAEIAELGRVSDEAEGMLYTISLRQDELGRQPTNLLLEKLEENPIYKELIDREYLTYEVFGREGTHQIASLYVTLKGMRYCNLLADSIIPKCIFDVEGHRQN